MNLTHWLAGWLASRGKFFLSIWRFLYIFVDLPDFKISIFHALKKIASYIYLFSVDLPDFDLFTSTPKKINRCGDD